MIGRIDANVWLVIGLAGLLFCLSAGIFMAWSAAGVSADEMIRAEQIAALQGQLATRPKEVSLQHAIRDCDAELRSRYLTADRLRVYGRWLVLIVGLISIGALWRWRCVRHVAPSMPSGRLAGYRWWSALGLIVGGVLCVVVFWSIGSWYRSPLVDALLKQDVLVSSKPAPDWQTMLRHWPAFRGGDGSGVCRSGVGRWQLGPVVWRVPLPLEGLNSAVIWDDRVFCTGATADAREVYCVGLSDGRLQWTAVVEQVPGSRNGPGQVFPDTGYAAPTCATDGRFVYAIFANGDLAAVDMAGKVVWSRNLGMPESMYSYASSLAVVDGKVIVQYDQGDVGSTDRGRLFAFDGATGGQVWYRRRPVGGSWTSPVVIALDGVLQVVVCADPWVIGYAVQTGALLWQWRELHGDLAPSPVSAGRRILVIEPESNLICLEVSGDQVTEVWRYEQDVADICSPVTDGRYVYMLSTQGMLSCVEISTGALVWHHAFGENFRSSPGLAGGYLWLVGTRGKVYQLQAGDRFEQVSVLDLQTPIQASPSFGGGLMVLRGARELIGLQVQSDVGGGGG